MKRVALGLLLALGAASAQAQDGGTDAGPIDAGAPMPTLVMDGSATYEFEDLQDEFGFGDAPGTNLTTGNGVDHTYTNWFWFRANDDTSETVFPPPSTSDFSGNVATLTWTDIAERGLADVVATYTITENDATSASVAISVAVTNTSGAELTFSVFGYNDFDVDDEADENSAALDGSSIVITGPASTVTVTGTDADAYQVGDYEDLEILLEDDMATTLDNSGLPFGPGDLAVLYSWDLTLAAGASETVATSGGVVLHCGDGSVDEGEMCDDGNTMDGDGCSSLCQDEMDGGVPVGDDAGTPIGLDGGVVPGSDGGGIALDGGSSSLDGGSASGDDAGTGSTPSTSDDSGCSAQGSPANAGLLVVLVGLLWRRRRG